MVLVWSAPVGKKIQKLGNFRHFEVIFGVIFLTSTCRPLNSIFFRKLEVMLSEIIFLQLKRLKRVPKNTYCHIVR